MPKPMHRSGSVRIVDRVGPKNKRHLIHYEQKKHSMPHCGICGAELNGISASLNPKGKSRRSVERKFGGVLCSGCTAEVVKLASRIESGELNLNEIGVRQRNYVLEIMPH